jgi:acyl transferase domain-containing protein
VGHLEGGSGLVGILKSVLMLEKAMIVPNALFEEANPELDLEFYNIEIPTKLVQWPAPGLRRISVNSFGFGGTNAHVVLDDAYHYLKANNVAGNHSTYQPTVNRHLPNDESKGHPVAGNVRRYLTSDNDTPTTEFRQLLVWSAADESALKRVVTQYMPYYRQQVFDDHDKLKRLAYTLSEKRSTMLWRSFALIDPNQSDLQEDLPISKPCRSSQTGVAFVFTGQGAEHVSMGLELMQYQVFRDTLQRFDAELAKIRCPWSLFGKKGNVHSAS